MKKSKVLIMADWYAPGFKAGGPIRSVVNFADQLENDFDIFIFTTDRDLGDAAPYQGIKTDVWVSVNQHMVFYASPWNITWNKLLSIFENINPDIVYLNSMFSRYFTIYPLLMKRLGMVHSNIILAPRGMLRDSALQHKANKKKIFIQIFKALGIPGLVKFHATDKKEENDIILLFGNRTSRFCIGNLSGKQQNKFTRIDKVKGDLKMIFIGRIHPIKNLDFVLRILQEIEQTVELTIIATLEDIIYWDECKKIISMLPLHIKVSLIQDLPHSKVASHILNSHLFVLPTLGENYGHAIFESLSQGRPVLISDQTPWRNLEVNKAGWDLPLNQKLQFTNAINSAIDWDQSEFDLHCFAAFTYIEKMDTSETLIQGYRENFSCV